MSERATLVPLVIQSGKRGSADEGLVGDILPELGRIGVDEGRRFLWLRLRQIPVAIYAGLNEGRYRIPFERLAWTRKVAVVDWGRVRDPNSLYQPFLGEMHEQPETGGYTSNGLILDPWGLFFDDVEQRYV